MKKPILILASLGLSGVLAVFVGARILGPKLISVAAPTGTPIGEFDVPKPETSILAVNLVVPLSLLNETANSRTPERFEGSEVKDFHKRIKNGGYAWDVARGEILFQNNGGGLSFTLPFEGSARIQGDLDAKIFLLPLNGTAEIGGTAGGTLQPEVLPDWQINPNLKPSVAFSKAAVDLGQLGRIDIGDMLGGTLGEYLQKEAGKLAPSLNQSIDLRREVTKLWEQAYISRMVSDDPPVWVNVTPRMLLLGPIDFSQPDQLALTVAVQSETYLSNREPVQSQLAPLPDMQALPGPTGTDLHLPLIVSMNELNEVISEESIEIDTGIGTKLRISGLEAEVGQKGLLNLKLNIEADKSRIGRGVAGSIWVKGRPVINYEDQTLGFTEVELTVETRDKLAGAAAWLLEGLLVRSIEAQLRVDLNNYKAELDEEVQKAISTANLPEGLDVSLQNLEVKLTDIYTITRHASDGAPDPGIVIVIRATGDMSTRINQLELKAIKEP